MTCPRAGGGWCSAWTATSRRWCLARPSSSTANTPARRLAGWCGQDRSPPHTTLPLPLREGVGRSGSGSPCAEGLVAGGACVADDLDLRDHRVGVASLCQHRQLVRGIGKFVGILLEAGHVGPDFRQCLGVVSLIAALRKQRRILPGPAG